MPLIHRLFLVIILFSSLAFQPLTWASEPHFQSPNRHEEEPFKKALLAFKAMRTTHPELKSLNEDRPTCFMSYAWGIKEHEETVHTLASHLKEAGINVLLDIWHNKGGTSTYEFTEKIPNADFVVLAATKKVLEKWRSDHESVLKVELGMIIKKSSGRRGTIIPIILEATHEATLPPSLHQIVSIWFQKKEEYCMNCFSLLGRLYQLDHSDSFIEKIRQDFSTQVALLQNKSPLVMIRGSVEEKQSSPLTRKKQLKVIAGQEGSEAQQAQYTLGIMFRDGEDVIKDMQKAIQWFEKAAVQGHIEAQNALCEIYMKTQDHKKLLKWVKKLVEVKDAEGQKRLGDMYRYGWGVEKDETEAKKWYKKAAEQGHLPAQKSLISQDKSEHSAKLLETSTDLKKALDVDNKPVRNAPIIRSSANDENKHISLSSDIAGRGQLLNQDIYGGLSKDVTEKLDGKEQSLLSPNNYPKVQTEAIEGFFHSGEEREKNRDIKRALDFYHQAALQKHVLAQGKLRDLYKAKQGIFADPTSAFMEYGKHSSKEDTIAEIIVGWMYRDGCGVQRDDNKAFTIFQKTAQQGYAAAQYNLGVMYQYGRGINRNEKEAVRWYEAAAEQGYAAAQCYLGVMYANGRGIEKNEKEAVKWYKAAAEQGDATAQYNLGVMYSNGQGTDKDDKEAVKWYLKAAEQGIISAQYNLGLKYETGLGVEKNEKEAVKWYRKAAEGGDSDAQLKLNSIYS